MTFWRASLGKMTCSEPFSSSSVLCSFAQAQMLSASRLEGLSSMPEATHPLCSSSEFRANYHQYNRALRLMASVEASPTEDAFRPLRHQSRPQASLPLCSRPVTLVDDVMPKQRRASSARRIPPSPVSLVVQISLQYFTREERISHQHPLLLLGRTPQRPSRKYPVHHSTGSSQSHAAPRLDEGGALSGTAVTRPEGPAGRLVTR